MTFAVATIFTACKKTPPEVIPEVLPAATFTYAPDAVVVYDVVQFTNTSTDGESYSWDFGNGETSTDADPSILFETTGDFVVKLTATNADGEDTFEETITVEAPHNYCTVTGSISYVDGDGVDHIDGYVYDGSEMIIDSAYWYSATQIRFFVTDSKFEGLPLVIKFTPNLGLGNLNQVYTFEAGAASASTYDFGISGGYAGMASEWTIDSWGMSGNPYVVEPYVNADVTLIYEPDEGDKIYNFSMENIIVNAGDFAPGFAYFLESTNPSTVTVHYQGTIASYVE